MTATTGLQRAGAIACLLISWMSNSVFAELPTVCAPCDVGGSMIPWIAPGSTSSYNVSGNNAVINQSLDRETFNWQSFNIGPDNTVTFNQPANTSIALNRIFQADPSRIFGALNANGQVMLINQNGILFGSGSRIDVNTLVASTLPLSDAISDTLNFGRGIETTLAPAFDADGEPVGDVTVESGATLSAAENGRVILLGARVENSGRIEVSGRGGQALLAAENDEVYLYVENDANFRGLNVALTDGGEVTNNGTILAERGNITMAGLTVNQNGLLRATTAVDANGSIRLLARDKSRSPSIIPGSGRFVEPVPTNGGDVTFGPQSVTTIVPENDTVTVAVDAQPEFRSVVEVIGADITLRGGSRIEVPAGEVEMTATSLEIIPGEVLEAPEGSITIESGASIDVSGLEDVSVSVARNFVEQEIRRNELADSPVQRDGPLFGETITFDIRKPLPTIADVEAASTNVGRSVLERSTVGGDISLSAAQLVQIEAGATLDVSGGVLNYEGAFVGSTKLIREGRVIDIADANADLQYDAVLGASEFLHEKWGPNTTEYFYSFGPAQMVGLNGFEPGYLEGKDAGSVAVVAPRFTIRGDLYARTTTGPLQREASLDTGRFSRGATEVPLGGRLRLSSTTLEQDLRFGDDGFGFVSDGFARYDIDAGNFAFDQNANLELPAGGALSVRVADTIRIAGQISGAGASVTLEANGAISGIEKLQDDIGSIDIGSTAVIDLEGDWVADEIAQAQRLDNAPISIDGGSINVNVVGELLVARGSFIDVGGGAYVDAAGNLTAGSGGSAEFSAMTFLLSPTTVDSLESVNVTFAPTLEGFTFAGAPTRSSLSLTAPEIVVGSLSPPARGAVTLPTSLFTDNGFHEFELRSNERVITLEDGIDLTIVARNLLLPVTSEGDSFGIAAANLPVTGTDVDDFAATAILEPLLRSPTSISIDSGQVFSTIGGAAAPNIDFVVPASASITVDTGGRIDLANEGGVLVAGALTARGGGISIDIERPGEFGYLPELALWIAPGAVLDVSGTTIPTAVDEQGRVSEANLIDAGTISLNAGQGYAIALPRATIDVSGGTGAVTRVRSSAALGLPEVITTTVGSDAGSVDVTAASGIQFFADLNGLAGSGGSRGGRLSITLDANLRDVNHLIGAPNVDYPSLISDGREQIRVLFGATELAGGLNVGDALPTAIFSTASFSLDEFSSGGFTDLDLVATPHRFQADPQVLTSLSSSDPVMEGVVQLVGDIDISIPGHLSINAPIIESDGGSVSIDATTIRVGFNEDQFVSSDTAFTGAESDPRYFSAEGGVGRVSFNAEFIEFEGFTSLHGFGGAGTPVSFNSDGDLRFRGVRTPSDISLDFNAALVTESNIALTADRIYATTLTNVTVTNELSDGVIFFGKNPGAPAISPLSAGTEFTVTADRIEQRGNLFAPIGAITLDAENSLVLAPGSLTSVTAIGQTILFGRTQVGDWVFPYNDFDNNTKVFDTDPNTVFALPPDKRITLIADGVEMGVPIGSVDIAPGARLDVRGGGDIVATEFLPGPFGKVSILETGEVSGSFALLPLSDDPIAAYDPLDTAEFEFDTYAQFEVVDGGAATLAVGRYAILPPRYALLPDAVLLTPTTADANQFADDATLSQNAAGLPQVLGRTTTFGQDVGDSRLSTYQVETSAEVRQRAEYSELSADQFFVREAADLGAPVPLVPRDSGSISILTNADFSLGGTIVEEINTTGIGSRVDIAAQRIAIGESADAGSVGLGTVFLDAGGLERLNADSILIGGVRTTLGSLSTIDTVSAETVTLLEDATLELSEVILVATDTVDLETGSQIRADRVKSAGADRLEVAGDGALVLSSAGSLPRFTRTGTSTGSTAKVNLADDVSIFSDGSMIIDTSGDATLGAVTLETGADAGVRFGAAAISIGDAPPGTPGLLLPTSLIDSLTFDASGAPTVSAFEIASRTTIDFFGDVLLTGTNLVLDAAGIRGAPGVGNVRIVSEDIRLENSIGADFGSATTGAGDLRLIATGQIIFGSTHGLDDAVADDGDFDVRGFDDVGFSAPSLYAVGGHHIDIDAQAVITAAEIAASSLSELDWRNSGSLSIDTTARTLDMNRPGLGAAIRIAADSLSIDTAITTPGGIIDLYAGLGDIELASSAELDVGGASNRVFGDSIVNTSGGYIEIESAAGNVVLGAGSAVSVAAGVGDFEVSAGLFNVSAPSGTLTVSPSMALRGAAADPIDGGRARFDIDRFDVSSGYANLIDLLGAGSFSGEHQLRVRGEALDVPIGALIGARRIRLITDTEQLTVAGTLDASGEQAGFIELIGGSDLVIAPQAELIATASGGFVDGNSFDDGYRGGTVHLTATGGALIFESAAGGRPTIDVAGTRAASDGSLAIADSGFVRLTAPRNAGHGAEVGAEIDGGGFELGRIEAEINGASRLDVVANKIYASSSGFSVESESQLVDQVLSGAGIAGLATRVVPGVEIIAPGDLSSVHSLGITYSSPFFPTGLFNFGPVKPGVLTFRVGGNLSVTADMIDGVTRDLFFSQIIDATDTWTLRFVSGADLASADPLATIDGGGDLTIGTNVDIWTGTGDIVFRSGGEIDILNGATVATIGRHDDPVIYQGAYNGAEFAWTAGASYPEYGGSIDVFASGDVNVVSSDQTVRSYTNYLGKIADATEVNTPRAWNYAITEFGQNFATLAGGNIRLETHGQLTGGQYTIATVGRQEGDVTVSAGRFTEIRSDIVNEIGGGDVNLFALGDIVDVDVTVVRGGAELRALGSIAALDPSDEATASRLFIGDAAFRLDAGRNIATGTIVDPTVTSPRAFNPRALTGVSFDTDFLSMTRATSLSIVSGGGNIVLENPFIESSGVSTSFNDLLNVYPGNLDVVAVSGDIAANRGMSVFPAEQGRFRLIASGSIGAAEGVISLSSIEHFEGGPQFLVTRDLTTTLTTSSSLLGVDVLGDTPLFAGDDQPNVVFSALGDVRNLDLTTPKLFTINAGRDITRFTIDGKHANATDASLVHAGRDIIQETLRNPVSGALTSAATIGYELAGSGEFNFVAGRDINLGTSAGIVTTGASVDPRLPERGGSVNLVAGIAALPDFGEFVASYADGDAGSDRDVLSALGLATDADIIDHFAASGSDRSEVLDVINRSTSDSLLIDLAGLDSAALADLADTPVDTNHAGRLRVFLAIQEANGRSLLTSGTPVEQFAALEAREQVALAADILFNELKASGSAASDPNSALFENYERGFAAIEMLYVGSEFDGDIRTPLSTVQTQEGGSVRVMAPGGLVDAGLAATEGLGEGFKEDKELGFIAFREGDIKAFVRDDFNVNSTRVFAQSGGDIVIWSSTGDIDAGRGAKTATTIDPPQSEFDVNGNFIDKPPLEVVGSGIRNFAPAGVEPGTLFLFAPQGIINAGDAGIGSAGNIVIGATEVIGADNIDIGGVAIGVPSGDTGGIAAGLASVGDVAAGATKATEKQTQQAAADQAAAAAEAFDTGSLSIIQVEVLGFGA